MPPPQPPPGAKERDSRVEDAFRTLNEAESKFESASSGATSFARVFGLSSASAKYEQAAELFQRAGNQFKLAKRWNNAGEAYVRAADCLAKLREHEHEVASALTDASTCFKKPEADPRRALDAMDRTISIHSERGRFGMAARVAKELAELVETQFGGGGEDSARVMEAYQRAADLYLGEDAKSHANGCLLKVAQYAALSSDYQRAIVAFEQAAQSALEKELLRYGARDYLQRAGICHLCLGDEVGARRALERYSEWDASFGDSRERRLLEEVLEAVGSGDVDAFTAAVYEYDTVSKLDSWKTSMLLRVKNAMKYEEEDLT